MPPVLRRRRIVAGIALAGVLGVLLGVFPAGPASAAGQPGVLVSITDADGTPITSVVPTSTGGEYQVRVSYTCNGDSACTNMNVSIAAPPKDPYYDTHRKEVSDDWIPPFSPAPARTGSFQDGWTVNLGTVAAGDTGQIVFRYFLRGSFGASQVKNGLGWGNFFPPGFSIDPEVTVTADNSATVTGTDHATYDNVVPTPGLSLTVPANVKTDMEIPVTVEARSGCWRLTSQNTFKAIYTALCSDSASVAVKLPAEAAWVPGSGGTYDAGTHTVTVTAGPDAWEGLRNGAFEVTFPSTAYPTDGTGCFVSETFQASGSAIYLNGDAKTSSPATMSRATTVDNCVPFMKGTFTKTGSVTTHKVPNAGPSAPQYWQVDTFHQGNKPGVVTVTDTALDQPGLPVHAIQTESTATISYTLDDGVTGQLTATSYTAPAGRRIVSATVVSAPLAGPNNEQSGTAATRFRVLFHYTVQPGATPGDRTNTASATITYPNYPEVAPFTPTGSPDTHTVNLFTVTPFAKSSTSKTDTGAGSYQIQAAAYGGYAWRVDTCNQSNVQGVATVTDNALDLQGIPVYRINTNLPADITYTLDNGTSGTVTGTAYLAPTGRRIVNATVVSSPLTGPNTASTGTACTLFRVEYLFRVEPTATPGSRTNTASVTMDYPNTGLGTTTPTGSPATETITLYNTPYTITANPVAAPTNTTNPGFTPRAGDEVLWKASGKFCGLTTDRATTPEYVFLAPKDWNVLAGGASLASVPGASFDYRTITYDGADHSAVVVRWPSPVAGVGPAAADCFAMSELSVKTTPTLAAVVGTQTAHFFVGDDADVPADAYSPVKVEESSTGSDIDADGNTTDGFALRTGTSGLQGVPGLIPVKEICQPDPSQADGCNWVADPAVTVGVPPNAPSIKYRVTIRNTGQTNLSNVVVYDVLPYPGDAGTSDTSASTPRGSTVKETLSNLTVDSPTGMTIAYSTSTNPPRPEVYSGPVSGTWTAPLAGASAIRATIPTLNASASRTFTFEAALVGGAADQTACNSVAVSANTLVASEPPRVCATTQEADFGIEATDRLPLQAERVGVVPFVVNNGGGSQSASATVTIQVPAEIEVVDLTPAGWACTAPSTSGPVELTCEPVNGDGTTRLLGRDVPETIELRVEPTADAPATLCFDAAVDGLVNDPNPDNDTARSCATRIAAEPELLVNKTDGKTAVEVGEEFTYTITASSRLVAEAIDDVALTDTLPESLELVSADPAPTSQSGQTLTWDLGRLEQAGIPGSGGGDGSSGGPGSAKSVTVTVRVKPGTQDSVTNSAEASGADPADATITLSADDDDVDSVTNVFTDEGAEETTSHNTPVTTPLADIASTTGAPLDPTAVAQATAPQHGSLTVNPTTGAVQYTPDAGYSGDDSYQVQVCDTSSPAQCFTATVVVHVGANEVDAVDDTVTTDAPDPVTTNVRGNDTSQSGQALAAPTVTTPPSNGTVQVNGDGTITYTPDAGTSGPDSLEYEVCDTSHPTAVCDTATVSITVRNVYVDSGIALTTPQNTPITTPLADVVTTTGVPIDPSTLSEATAPQHGTLSIDTTTGAVTYTPSPGYSGPDSYELSMCDVNGTDCHLVTVPVMVQPNVVGAVDDTAATDAPESVTTNVRGNDTSASGQAFAAPTVQSGPDHGTVGVNGDGSITYTPDAGFSGTDSYTYQVCDTSTPTPVCDTAAVTILVRNVFTELGATGTTPHNTEVTTPLAEIVSTTGAALDPTTVAEHTAPAHGSIDIDPATGAVRYTPEPGYAGADSYDVRVCDTSTPDPQCFIATVQVTVQPNVVDAVDDTSSTGAGDPVAMPVRANDTSASGQPLAMPTIVTGPGRGTVVVNADGSTSYTPATGFSGTDVYTYRVCDTSHPTPVCDTATVTITVAAARFDLKLTNRLKSAAKVVAGDTVRYRLQVTNRGPDDVAGPIVLTDTMPRGLDVVSAKGDGWRCKLNKRSDKVTCTFDVPGQRAGVTLAAGQQALPVFVVARTTAKARGKLVNTATVQAAGDTAVANNRAKASVRVAAVPTLPETGFRLTLGRLF